MRAPGPPLSQEELLLRARALDGQTIGALAQRLGVTIAADPRRTKGKIGELIERALGAVAGNLDLPDFPHLGVELKTIPVDRLGRVRESTYVCAIDLERLVREEWASSRARRKLACVLWMPVEAAAGLPLPERHVGTPCLWRPSHDEEALLAADWTALAGLIATGGVEELSAHLGEALQIRPKAADASVRTQAPGPDGEPLPTVPLGFYLRARFTEALLWRD